jgi:hypothetical protein
MIPIAKNGLVNNMEQFDITKAVPRASPKPKVCNPFPIDTSALTKRLIREYYPELEDRLIRD